MLIIISVSISYSSGSLHVPEVIMLHLFLVSENLEKRGRSLDHASALEDAKLGQLVGSSRLKVQKRITSRV
jgi:hypothetical protein